VPKADNLTTFVCRFSGNLGASHSWSPQGSVQTFTCDSFVSPVHGIKYKIKSSPVVTPNIYFTLAIRGTFPGNERSQNVVYIRYKWE